MMPFYIDPKREGGVHCRYCLREIQRCVCSGPNDAPLGTGPNAPEAIEKRWHRGLPTDINPVSLEEIEIEIPDPRSPYLPEAIRWAERQSHPNMRVLLEEVQRLQAVNEKVLEKLRDRES